MVYMWKLCACGNQGSLQGFCPSYCLLKVQGQLRLSVLVVGTFCLLINLTSPPFNVVDSFPSILSVILLNSYYFCLTFDYLQSKCQVQVILKEGSTLCVMEVSHLCSED